MTEGIFSSARDECKFVYSLNYYGSRFFNASLVYSGSVRHLDCAGRNFARRRSPEAFVHLTNHLAPFSLLPKVSVAHLLYRILSPGTVYVALSLGNALVLGTTA